MTPSDDDTSTPAWPTPRSRPTPPTPPPASAPAEPPTVAIGPAPPRQVGNPPPGVTPPVTAPPPTAPPPTAWPATSQPGAPGAAPPRKRRRGLIAVALIAVGALAVAGVGLAVFRAVRGDGGGASSPEAAVRQLAEAVEAEDPIALLDVIEPDEAEALGEVYRAAADRSADLDLSPAEDTFGGVDVELTSLRYEVDELGDGAARVSIIGGRGTIGFDPGAFGGLTRDVVERESDGDGPDSIDLDVDDLAATPDDSDDDEIPPFLVAVERDGGWYVSPLHTAAQYAVEVLGLDAPDLPTPEAGVGADSPDDAVRALLTASGTLDADATGDAASGPVGRAVRAYASALEQWVGHGLDEAETDIDRFETDVSERDAGGRRVVVTELEGSVTATETDGDPETYDVRWDGECLDVTGVDDDDAIDDADAEPAFCLTDGWRTLGIEELALVTVEEGDGWRVDPLATLADYATAIAPNVSAEMVLRMIGRPEAAEPAAELSPGEMTSTELNDAGFVVLTFLAEAGERLTIDARLTDDEVDDFLDGYLVDPNGDELSAFSIVDPPASGEYRLVLGTETWRPFDIEVTVSDVTEESISVDETVSGEITAAGQIVEYSIELEGGRPYEIDFSGPAGIDRSVIDPDGDSVALATAEGGAETFTTGDAGRYRVRIADSFAGTTGSFTLTVSEGAVFTLGDGSSAITAGSVDTPGDEPYVDLTVTGGAVVSITATTTDPTFDIVIVIRDPATNDEIRRFDETGPGGAEGARFSPDDTLTWRIGIQGANDTTGPVTVEAFEQP
ncbi:MAG: hypothetical protein GXY13_03700 [Acidimicrobiales bacterium]|nr:hypothetical protein [Acidimicrobiales bacterium]